MREGRASRRRTESRKAPVKVSRLGTQPQSEPLRARGPEPWGKGSKDRLGRLLEEWLAEARIRYTHAGD